MSKLLDMPIPILGAGIVMVLFFGAIYLFGLTKRWGVLLPYCGMLLFSAMSIPVEWNGRVNPTIWLPVQEVRSTLFLTFGIATGLCVLIQLPRQQGKAISITCWMLFLVSLYAALLRIVHEGVASGIESIFFIFATLLPLIFVPGLVIERLDDFKDLLRTIAVMSVIWTGMVIVQIAVNPQYVTIGLSKRFVGLTGNPQHCGTFLAYVCVVLLWLLLNDTKRYRFFYIALLGVNTVFLLWTGSRTGLGMTLIGTSAVLYARAGKAIFVLPIAAGVIYAALKIVTDVLGLSVGLERLVSTDNTRAGSWRTLLQYGMDNPMIGVGIESSVNSENSYLYGFAAYGVGMLGLMLLFTFIAFLAGLKWIRARFKLPYEYRPMLDLCSGAIAMYFAGAVLEGYILSRVSALVCFFPIFCGAGAILSKVAFSGSAVDYEESDYESEYAGSYADWDGAAGDLPA